MEDYFFSSLVIRDRHRPSTSDAKDFNYSATTEFLFQTGTQDHGSLNEPTAPRKYAIRRSSFLGEIPIELDQRDVDGNS
jgi:hypothetical protein